MLMPVLSHKHPLLLLRQIERRSKQHARGLPLQFVAKKIWSGVGFRVSNAHLVAPLLQVREILTYPTLSPVPGAKTWLNGIANVRGNLLPIINLRSYLGNQDVSIGRRNRVLVIKHSGIDAGLVVDEILGMKHFLQEEYSPQLPQDAGNFGDAYLEGSYIRDGLCWGVFSMHRLAQSASFLQPAI